MTPVLFRCDRNGDNVTAVFPTIPGSPGFMSCYAHIGQHGSCGMEWYYSTRPAKPHEYADLRSELISIGYTDLRVYQRITRDMRDELARLESTL